MPGRAANQPTPGRDDSGKAYASLSLCTWGIRSNRRRKIYQTAVMIFDQGRRRPCSKSRRSSSAIQAHWSPAAFPWPGASEAAPRFFEIFPDIGAKGAPCFETEAIGRDPPQNDLGLAKQCPRAHADRKGARRQIERATRIQEILGLWSGDLESAIAVADVHEGVGQGRARLRRRPRVSKRTLRPAQAAAIRRVRATRRRDRRRA